MIDLRKLLEAGVHFGHRTSRWSPKMKPFIWGAKNKIHLIDVAKTAFLLDRATKFLTEAVKTGRPILWVGTKKAAAPIIEDVAKTLDMPYVIHRWIGGTLSNFTQVKKAVTRLLHLQDALTKSKSYHTKKEMSVLQKEIMRLEKNVGGIIDLAYPPAALFVIDAKREHAAVQEALTLGIPVVAIVDTNTDPTGINFVIPSNDDAPRAISCIIDYIKTPLIEVAKELQAQKAKKSTAAKASEPTKKETQAVEEIVDVTDEQDDANTKTTFTSKVATKSAPKKTLIKKSAPMKAKEAAPKAGKKTVTKASIDADDDKKTASAQKKVTSNKTPKNTTTKSSKK